MKKSLKPSLIIAFILCATGIFAQESISELSKKIKAGDQSSELYLKRAQLYDQQDDFSKSNADYKQVVENYESGADKNKEAALTAYYRLADDHMYRNSEASNALQYLMKGLDIDPAHKGLLLIKAEAMHRMGQNDKAFAIYEQLYSKYPDDMSVIKEYALKLEKRDTEDAKELYDKVIANDPSNIRAQYFLGMYYTHKSDEMNKAGKHPKEVRPVMQKGVDYLAQYYAQNPEDEATKESLIMFYQNLGQADKAAELQNQ